MKAQILFIDRILLQMMHDKWCRDRKSYKLRKSGILKTWQQTKQQLVLKVTAVLTEASHKAEEMQRNNAEKDAQMKYCKHLIDKVFIFFFFAIIIAVFIVEYFVRVVLRDVSV